MEGIDHLDLAVTYLERRLEFYRDLLAPLGYTRESRITGERGEPSHISVELAVAARSACASVSRTLPMCRMTSTH